jgi:hypothetical protein
MDHADRIPIDTGYEVAADAGEQPQRFYILADGTLSVDPPPPVCEAEPSTEPQIVVCAQTEGQLPSHRVPPPPRVSVTERISSALRTRIGPVEVGSIPQGDGTYALGLRIRF